MTMTSPIGCLHPRNLLTYTSLFAGIGAVASSAWGSAGGAGALVALAVIADTFDGRFARLFRSNALQRAFGAHLDSLSDAIAFGIAPAVCAALLAPTRDPTPFAVLWWAAACFYAACAVTRLGFYHLPHASETVFVGLPVPVAALIWTTALLWAAGPAASMVVFITTGIAMVAPLPIARPAGLSMAAFVAWPLLVAGAHAVALVH